MHQLLLLLPVLSQQLQLLRCARQLLLCVDAPAA
jgi:hypothetical protein